MGLGVPASVPNLLRPQDIQPDDDLAVTLASKREQRIKREIKDALIALGLLLSGSAIAALIARWDVRGIEDVLDREGPSIINPSYQPVADLTNEAANAEVAENLSGIVRYDELLANASLIAARDRFAANILDQSKTVMQQSILNALRYGIDPVGVQEALKMVIGLTPREAQAVENFRRLLTEGDKSALTRVLRDQRYDGTVSRAIESGVSLEKDQIDAMVARYAERMLSHRAETIARTEGMQAAVNGIRGAYVQAVDTGKLLNSEVKRFWLTARDELVCPVCSSIPRLNRDGVGVHEPYESSAGMIIAPLAHVRCRCSEHYKTNLNRVTQQPFAWAA